MPDTQPTPRVTADDIPASVTKLAETAPNVAMTYPRRAAWALAHFWPAIEQHIRERDAQEIARLRAEVHQYRTALQGATASREQHRDQVLTEAVRLLQQRALKLPGVIAVHLHDAADELTALAARKEG